MTLAFSSLLPDVVTHAPGATDPIALHYLRLSAIDFCEQTSLWTELLPAAVALTSTSFPLTLTSTLSYAQVIRLGDVFWNDVRLYPWAAAHGSETTTNWRALTGTPKLFQTLDARTMTVTPLPDEAGDLTVQLVLAPTLTADEMEESVLQRYREGIIAGALSRLCAVPNQTFSNSAALPLYSQVFAAAVHEGRSEAHTGYTSAPMMVRLRPFA